MKMLLATMFFAVAADLTLDDLLYKIDGNIHIAGAFLGADQTALDRNGHLNGLNILLDRKGNVGDGFRREVPGELAKLFFYLCLKALR